MQGRVQKILAAYGIASRRKAEELILAGRVTVNGRLCALGQTAETETDEILVDGKPLLSPPKMVYIMLNKPRGYVTTAKDERGRKTVLELVDCGQRVYPVGRLDMDSEGLLLMTNDGALTNQLLHPSKEIPKVYRVQVSGFSAKGLEELKRPMTLDGYQIQPAGVKLLWENREHALLEITIHEGRNRQIRKMAAQCGMKVLRLKRVREGPLLLGELAPGAWRYLTEEEQKQLRNLHEKP